MWIRDCEKKIIACADETHEKAHVLVRLRRHTHEYTVRGGFDYNIFQVESIANEAGDLEQGYGGDKKKEISDIKVSYYFN